MQNRHTIFTLAAFLASLVSPVILRACTIAVEAVEVGNEFRVRVTDRGQPVKGLRMILAAYGSSGSQGEIVNDSITDAEGIARFSISKPGSLVLSPDHEVGIGESIDVYVSLTGPKNKILPLEWPYPAPLVVRTVEGTLRRPNYFPTQTQAEMSLSLLEGISGKEIERTKTDSKGRFHFSNPVSTGLYFIHLNPAGTSSSSDEDGGGSISIQVDPVASDHALDLDIGWTSCGLVYAKRVAQPELILDEVCGKVNDSEGGVISRAQVWLQPVGSDIASSDAMLTQSSDEILTSDAGEFSFQERREGTYQLIVQSLGFRPYVRQIHLRPSGASAGCSQPAHVVMDAL